VTRGEAQVALHARIVSQVTSSLGPTCILKLAGRRPSVTFGLQPDGIRHYISRMQNPSMPFTIRGHRAYCGTLGRPLLFVDVGRRRSLEVAAPCAAAEALASRALTRVRA
jgi:hypothetical protein